MLPKRRSVGLLLRLLANVASHCPSRLAAHTCTHAHTRTHTQSILANRNPTCDLRSYVGGLNTCHHTWKLLDAEQDIPWQDQPLVYYKKYRIYFQEYSPPSTLAGSVSNTTTNNNNDDDKNNHNNNESSGPSHVQIVRHDYGIGASASVFCLFCSCLRPC